MKKFRDFIVKLFTVNKKEDTVLAIARISEDITKTFKDTCIKLEQNMDAAEKAIEEERAAIREHEQRVEELANTRAADERFVNNLKSLFA